MGIKTRCFKGQQHLFLKVFLLDSNLTGGFAETTDGLVAADAVSVTLARLIVLMRRLVCLSERRSLTAMNAKHRRGEGRPVQAEPRRPDVLGSAAAFTSHSLHSEFYG